MNIKDIESPFRLLQHNILDFKFTNKKVIQVNQGDIKRICNTDYNIVHKHVQDNYRYGVVELFIKTKRFADNKEDFNVTLCMNGVFSVSTDMSEKTFDTMLEYNGVTALYGIARGNISALSALCYPSEPITLPMVNIHSLVEKHHNSKKAEDE